MLNARALYEGERRRWTRESKTRAFWIFAALGTLAGGLMAVFYAVAVGINVLVALNIGVSWPLIVRRSFGAVPEQPYRKD